MDEIELEMYRGDSFMPEGALEIRITDVNGLPEDFTDATFRFAIGANEDITEDTTNVVITNGGVLGTVSIFVPYTEMEDLAVGDYDFDVEATWPDGRRDTIIKGVLSILSDVRATPEAP